jgi:hypothetical protein
MKRIIPGDELLHEHLQKTVDQQPVYHHHQVDRDEPQDGAGQDQGGVAADGGQHELDGDDDRGSAIPQPMQLGRRKFQLKVGVRRDTLLQPTLSNYFYKKRQFC